MVERLRAAAGADVIGVCYLNPGVRAITDACRRAFGGEPTEVWIGRGWNTVAAIALARWREPNIVRVFATGINRAVHAANLVVGYAESVMEGTHNLNAASWEDMEQLFDRQLTRVLQQSDYLEVYGHSAGGVLVECLAAFDRTTVRDRGLSIVTYGSPCPGSGGGWVPMARDRRQRFMLWGDVVPFVPAWAINQRSATMLAIGELSVRRAQDVVRGAMVTAQPHNGIMIRGDVMTRRDDPQATGRVEESVARWVNGDEGAQVNHSIAEYAAGLRGISRDYTEPAGGTVVAIAGGSVQVASELVNVQNLVIPFPLPGAGAETGNVVLPLTVRPAGDVETPDGVHVGTMVLTGRDRMFLKLAPAVKFHQVKVGRSWQVRWQETIVAVCDQGHKANALTKRLNGALSAVSTTTTLYTENLLTSLSTCITACAAGPPACRPAMRADL